MIIERLSMKTSIKSAMVTLLMLVSGTAMADKVTFVECSWDDANKRVLTNQRTEDCSCISGDQDNWEALGEKGKVTWYYVKNYTHRKVIVIYGEVHIVLLNNCTFNLNHIKLESQNDGKLHIHTVNGYNTGKIEVKNWYTTAFHTIDGYKYYYDRYYKDAAAVGGGGNQNMGSLFMHGGTLSASIQDMHPAAIGGGKNGSIDQNHRIVVYAGVLKGEAFYPDVTPGDTMDDEVGLLGAAIGGSDNNPQGGPIFVYGGMLIALNDGKGAGIGGGEDSFGGTVKVYGGKVIAKVRYFSEKGGAGIGGGYEGGGGDVHIYGGSVEVVGGEKSAAIGGYQGHGKGTLEIASNMRVTAGSYDYDNGKAIPERVFTTLERENACHYRSWARVEPCDHTAQNGDELEKWIPGDEYMHLRPCRYCEEKSTELHKLPDENHDVCDVCGRNIKDICYYMYDDKDNETVIGEMAYGSQEGGHIWNVMLKDHTFYHDGNWNTLTLPFELKSFAGTPLEGATVERIKSASLDDNGVLTINLEEVKSIEYIKTENGNGSFDISASTLGRPLFVKWPQGENVTNPRFNNVKVVAEKSSNWFEGKVAGTFQPLYAPLDITSKNIDNIVFLGPDNTLGYSAAPRQLHAFRGYFHIGTIAGVRGMTRAIINHGDDGATSIGRIENGMLIIESHEGWFDLQGRRLNGEPTQKGIYIHNGKKVLKK